MGCEDQEGGSSAAFGAPRPEDWPADVGRGRTVTVVGAGIAGLTATLELERLGFDCTLLEARSSPGGRNRTLRGGDSWEEMDGNQTCEFDRDPNLYFNAGPSRIPHHHELLLSYCRELGVPLETFTNDNRAALIHDPNQFGGEPQIARRLRADIRGHLAHLLAEALERGALDGSVSSGERTQLREWLRSFGDLDAQLRYSGSSRAGFPGQGQAGSRARGERLEPRALSALLDDGFWLARLGFTDGLNQQSTMLQPVGGMDNIVVALKAEVEAQLQLSAVVTELRKQSEGVVVRYVQDGRAQERRADFGLVTIPAPVLSDVPNDFSDDVRGELGSFQYTSAVRVAFQSPRFWERRNNIYGGISWSRQPITQVWYPSHGLGAEKGVILGAYAFGGPSGDLLTAQSPAQRLATARSQASALHPEFSAEVSKGIGAAWKKVPFQLGGWGVSTPDALLRPDGRYLFAGEHLSQLQGWQEGAIQSAYRAIDRIVDLVSS